MAGVWRLPFGTTEYKGPHPQGRGPFSLVRAELQAKLRRVLDAGDGGG